MNYLTSLLFQHDQLQNFGTANLIVLPNIMQGVDIKTRSGELLATSTPDVFGNGEVFYHSNGEMMAHVNENVWGGTKIDFGGGEVVNGYSNIYGGENFASLEGMIGYSAPNFQGGMDFFSATGEKIATVSESSIGGLTVNTPISVDIPYGYDHFEFTSSMTHLTELNSFVDIQSFSDLFDAADSVSSVADIFGIF